MHASDNELVSVIIPTRNRRERLTRAIESVRNQTWKSVEIIVVDDASSDGTKEFLCQLATKNKSIKFIRNEIPEGGAGARNTGVRIAQGPFIAFLDDDDVWLPEKLEYQINAIRGAPDASAVSCWFHIEGARGVKSLIRLYAPTSAQEILHFNHLGGASMCLTTKTRFDAIGGFDPGLRSGQDWDLWIKLFDQGKVLVCERPLVCYLPHDGERITSNPHSVYRGRRRIYMRYKGLMSEYTQRSHLAELIYCRKVLLGVSTFNRIAGVLAVLRFCGALRGSRYLYRYGRDAINWR
jgi:glycosyltransferase involved in cell wall biosynthesis